MQTKFSVLLSPDAGKMKGSSDEAINMARRFGYSKHRIWAQGQKFL
jgi:hypothetical protein